MKKLLIAITCLLSLSAGAQQKMNTFYLVDDSTKSAIPAVSVSIVRAKLSITTEKDGIFKIPGDLSKMRDTIIFFAQHYIPLRLRLRDLSTMSSVGLKRDLPAAKMANIKLKKDTLLNDFSRLDVSYYVGLHADDPSYDFLQLAQKFEAPKAGCLLTRVNMHRLAFFINYYSSDPDRMARIELEHTKFRLRIYDIDATTGGPGKDLCDQIIEVSSSDQKELDISLNKYNIIIPNKTFFVAVEWLRDYYNGGSVSIYDFKTHRYKEHGFYKPSIGISPNTDKMLNIWALDFAHRWKPYTEFSPFGTDLAIKVNVEY
ncbi:hypothetical protein [Mucilaginibacter panaciglaebae]|uniref:Carboxypeptidase-like protein n=1 Tax=Mucilaginibacter panaciglaebae TaxID=502331 RepID=A0ABP7WC64_9SPHI